jgi:hypothetical protein
MKKIKKKISYVQLSKNKTKKINKYLLSKYLEKNIDLLKIYKKKNYIDLPDLRNDISLCLFLENQLKNEILKIIPDNFKSNCSLQFPPNIRVTTRPIKKKDEYGYSTNKLHTDVWSGAPLESRNFIYYAYVTKNSSYCKVFDTLRGNKIAEKYRGPYDKQPININKKSEIKYKISNGTLISFDSMCPHFTYFPSKKNGLRLTLDFRIKLGNPYFYEKKLVSKNKFIISKKGQPALGYYWEFNKKKFKTFDEKVKNELLIAKKISNKVFLYRTKYLKNKKYI